MLLLLSGFYFLRGSGGTVQKTKRKDDWLELLDDDDVAVAYALTLT